MFEHWSGLNVLPPLHDPVPLGPLVWKIIKKVRPAQCANIFTEGATADRKPRSLFIDPGGESVKYYFEGPVRLIRTSVSWQDPLNPTCEHLRAKLQLVPPTVKVHLVAKLSNEDDEQLEEEAKNYREFPRHMFEHWSGLNVLPPRQDPVPVGALVPQFYGNYAPEPETEVRPEEGEEDVDNSRPSSSLNPEDT